MKPYVYIFISTLGRAFYEEFKVPGNCDTYTSGRFRYPKEMNLGSGKESRDRLDTIPKRLFVWKIRYGLEMVIRALGFIFIC